MQKSVQLFHVEACPYCQETRGWIRDLKNQYPELRALQIELIDEKKQPDIAVQYDYWYVPTFFVDGNKVHEGVCSKETTEHVLRLAIGSEP